MSRAGKLLAKDVNEKDDLYIVTAVTSLKGQKDVISKPLNKKEADNFKASLEKELTNAAPKYQWAKDVKVEKANV